MRCQQFKATYSKRGSRVIWHLIDRVGNGVLASGDEPTKGKAIEAVKAKQAELGDRYLSTSAIGIRRS